MRAEGRYGTGQKRGQATFTHIRSPFEAASRTHRRLQSKLCTDLLMSLNIAIRALPTRTQVESFHFRDRKRLIPCGSGSASGNRPILLPHTAPSPPPSGGQTRHNPRLCEIRPASHFHGWWHGRHDCLL